ncbi:DNA sulfur modification protein DndB [Thiocapsa marina]|uniref:DNA sulfur modification protein DndB n=1 Tax=Thiocapsa marina 5811 TaxID=768671 RepID=F9U5V6_9GAMM|nr:DNA sulfur modification protein DndB [Thiocapsa marina]EGV20529.1 DNA sulfur modification protein DndB [Thiocapsa marina 5811]
MDTAPTLTFPVIRGLEAGREYFVAMWTLRMLRRISVFHEDDLPPEMRSRRTLNPARVPEISEYILDNPDDYVLSAITVSIDSDLSFDPLPGESRLGILRVPMDARFVMNDGHHRRAAIIEVLKQRPELAQETIAVMFFRDTGLERCRQMFSDLNRHAIRPSRSLGLLYEQRDDKARLAKLVVMESEIFRNIMDMQKTSLAKRSRKLFTLSALHNACADFMTGMTTGNLADDAALARGFWEAVALEMPTWIQVKEGNLSAGEVREGFVHAHGITLQALGRSGNALLQSQPDDWRDHLVALRRIDWSRSNTELWDGRALVGGKVVRGNINLVLTTNVIKQVLGLPLDAEEQNVENTHRAAREPVGCMPK